VTLLASMDLIDTRQKFRRSSLTKEQVFRLWRCAIKDDHTLVDELIQHAYEEMIAFECERAEWAMELMVRRNMTAGGAFRSLLNDIRLAPRALRGPAAGFVS
jgi:hypothetical protein